MEENIECGGFTFLNSFDSANLGRIEKVEVNKPENGKGENKTYKNASYNEFPVDEFNLWTKHDCHGTEFENNNRTWFYFGIKASTPNICVKLNLVNLNKQLRMFSQGMCPVYKIIPGHPQWERIKDKPTFTGDDKSNEFTLSFTFRTPDNSHAITYFAFTYPFSYTDLQNYLRKIDLKMMKRVGTLADDIYYHRECAITSLEGRRLDVLTISSYYNILPEREPKIKDLFKDKHDKRPFKFHDKKVIFISARVHPGETPSSFVLNGFLNLLLNREDPIAITLRRLYIFKLIPMLNPDGVAQGYYRMDTKGINLNRYYLNPSKKDHPTIFAAKTLLRFYHHSYNLPIEKLPVITNTNNINSNDNLSCINVTSKDSYNIFKLINTIPYEENNKSIRHENGIENLVSTSEKLTITNEENQLKPNEIIENVKSNFLDNVKFSENAKESGIFLYLDLHGHASKKGIFMYGNHFDDPDKASACMLLPKLMSINNSNFHFTSCNFAEKNMYLVDKRDGMSREGSGRVAVYKLTGLIYSYTLECNYNTGRLVNTVPPKVKEGSHKYNNQLFIPPKYNPAIFEEVGAAFGPSILDMTGSNPNSRIPNSHYRSLKGLQAYLKLISASNYQTKPLNKNNGSDQFRIPEESTTDDVVKLTIVSKSSTMNSKSKNKTNFKNNSNKNFSNDNIYGPIRKIKNSKKHCQVVNRNNKKFSNGKKNNNRETKIIVSKIISSHIKPKSNLATSTSKKIKTSVNSKFSSKEKVSKSVVEIEQKSSVKNSLKKSTICAKRTTIKKQGTKKLKSIASKVRHRFQTELGESSIDKVTNFVIAPHSKRNKTNNFVVKDRKLFKNLEMNIRKSLPLNNLLSDYHLLDKVL